MTDEGSPKPESPKLERLSAESLEAMEKPQLISTMLSIYEYLDGTNQKDLQTLKESEEKYKQQLSDVTRRETLLLKSLTEKEREINDLASQIDELKQYQLPSNSQLRSMLLDPTVNVVINSLKKELDNTKQRLEEAQTELSAWKFTQDSQTGKQLMARCRTLLKENEELGKQISQGRIAKLEGEIALEKKLVEEMKVAQNETEQFVMELDEDTEGLQATVYLLQQQLKEANQKIEDMESGQVKTDTKTENGPPVTVNAKLSTYKSDDFKSAVDNGEEVTNLRTTKEEPMETTGSAIAKSEIGSKQVTSITNGHGEMIATM